MDLKRLRLILDRAASKRILVIGDLMLDKFIRGTVGRISPEAPVPVVEVSGEKFYPGGAANVARNIRKFGANAAVAGMIGSRKDKYGQKLRGELSERNIDSSLCIEREKFWTTIKTRIIAGHQHIVRLDREKITVPSPSEVKNSIAQVIKRMAHFDAVIFEDYGKGFLTQEMIDQVGHEARQRNKIVAADPNPRHPLNWSGMTLVKPNRSEALAASGIMTSKPADSPEQDEALLHAGEILLEKWQPRYLLISLGEHGVMLFQKGEEPHHIPTKARDVFDVSGAGDTAIALFTLALACEADPIEAAEIANHGSAVVIGKSGTATVTPAELISNFEHDFD